ncbi:hypothetical protein J4Y12_24460, partial [Escherichia coli]|nr:hypothetical protein [Escherichia coli]
TTANRRQFSDLSTGLGSILFLSFIYSFFILIILTYCFLIKKKPLNVGKIRLDVGKIRLAVGKM